MDWLNNPDIGGILAFQDNIAEILNDGVWRSRSDLFLAMSRLGWRFTFRRFKEVIDSVEERGGVRTMQNGSDQTIYQNPLTPEQRKIEKEK